MSATDAFAGHTPGLDSPYTRAAAVTPDDANDLGYVTRGVNVQVAGNVKVTMLGGDAVVLALPVGTTRIRVSRIWAASTTATGISALW
jgi:hypothetical protein